MSKSDGCPQVIPSSAPPIPTPPPPSGQRHWAASQSQHTGVNGGTATQVDGSVHNPQSQEKQQVLTGSRSATTMGEKASTRKKVWTGLKAHEEEPLYTTDIDFC